jgi:hypothetical protein
MSLAVNKILNASYEGVVLAVTFPKKEDKLPKPGMAIPEIDITVSDKLYFYKAKFPLEIGSHVVVPAPRGFSVAVVYSVVDETALDLDHAEAYQWIVQPIDFTEYRNYIAKDAALVAQVAKAQRQNIRQQVLESVRSVGLDPAFLVNKENLLDALLEKRENLNEEINELNERISSEL